MICFRSDSVYAPFLAFARRLGLNAGSWLGGISGRGLGLRVRDGSLACLQSSGNGFTFNNSPRFLRSLDGKQPCATQDACNFRARAAPQQEEMKNNSRNCF